MTETPEHRDVVVLGGGIAGLSAAWAAADRGADVLLMEGSDTFGGAALLSNGSVWTFTDAAQFATRCTGANPVVADLVTAGLPGVVSDLERRGVRFEHRRGGLYGADESHRVEPQQLVDTLVAQCRDVGVTLVRACRATRVHRSGERVQVGTADGREFVARAIVLATGGIHADEATLASAHVAHYAALALRNRQNPGDGVRLGLSLGGRLAGPDNGIYGHLVPEGLGPGMAVLSEAAQYQSCLGVLLDRSGALLAAPGTDDHDLNRLLTGRRDPRALLLFPATAGLAAFPSGVTGRSKADFARRNTPFAVPEIRDMDDLIGALAAWDLPPPRHSAAAAVSALLAREACLLMRVVPSLTHAGVGLAVDGQSRALHVSRISRPAVLVAGADIGNAFGSGYGGGLATALTTGRAAGAGAADSDSAVARSRTDA